MIKNNRGMLLSIILGFGVLSFSLSSFALSNSSVVQVNPDEGRLVPEWRSEFNPLARHFNSKPDQSYVFLMSFAPEKTISFKNGASLKNSMIALRKNQLGSVGHTMVGWSCSNGRSITSRGLSAFSGEVSKQAPDLRDRGFGLLGALAIYTDGYLQDSNTPALNYKFSKVQDGTFEMKWIAVKVSDSACRRVPAFRDRFRRSGASRNFGFNLDPASLEGAGCSSYARHLLYEAGVLNSTARHWTRSVVIPYALIANPPQGSVEGNELGGVMTRNTIFKFPLSSLDTTPITTANLALRSWNFGQPGYPIDFTDTELVFYTISEIERTVKNGRQGSFPNMIGTGFRSVRETDGGRSSNVRIDENLDANTRSIYGSVRSNNRLDAVSYSHSMINGVTGLILESGLQ